MNIVFLLACFTLLMLPTVDAVLNKDNVVVAINCGSHKSYKTPSEIEYSEDTYFKGGVESDLGERYSDLWPDMSDIELYQTERYTNGEFLTYELPLKLGAEDGHYVLVLKFSEVYFDAPNRKVFDVTLGSQTILNNVDIFAAVGKFAPYDEFVEFDIKQKMLYYKGKAVDSAYLPKKSTVVVKFLRGKYDNPKINAMVLVKGTLQGMERILIVRYRL